MELYKDFRPSRHDTHISIPGEESREDWLVVPCNRNRDSDCLSESNFHSALKQLGGESETVEVHRFGHWACGWFEIIIVKPNSPAHTEAQAIEDALENYPILDESDYSDRQQEAANEVWANCYDVEGRIKYIREHRNQFEFHSFVEMLHCVRGKCFCGYASELAP